MRTLLAGALALLVAAPASAQIRKFQDWIAACDNQRNCVAYSWNRDSYNTYLRIQRDGAPSADAKLTLAIAQRQTGHLPGRCGDRSRPVPAPCDRGAAGRR